jgi:hypothetical protein
MHLSVSCYVFRLEGRSNSSPSSGKAGSKYTQSAIRTTSGLEGISSGIESSPQFSTSAETAGERPLRSTFSCMSEMSWLRERTSNDRRGVSFTNSTIDLIRGREDVQLICRVDPRSRLLEPQYERDEARSCPQLQHRLIRVTVWLEVYQMEQIL